MKREKAFFPRHVHFQVKNGFFLLWMKDIMIAHTSSKNTLKEEGTTAKAEGIEQCLLVARSFLLSTLTFSPQSKLGFQIGELSAPVVFYPRI